MSLFYLFIFFEGGGGGVRFTLWLFLVTHWKSKRHYLVDHIEVIMTKIPFKDYQNAKKLSTDVFYWQMTKLQNVGSSYAVVLTKHRLYFTVVQPFILESPLIFL